MKFDQLTRFMFVDPEFYEDIERYRPDRSVFIDLVKSLLPEGWAVGRQGVWAQCRPAADKTPPQGWKIHVSATPDNGRGILGATVPILAEFQVAFKFALDNRMLALLCGRNWPRAGAGKFLTIYPHDESQFRNLLERLNEATRSFHGPHILSDRRFSNSKVIHYRYGTMLAPRGTDASGEAVPYLVGPGGIRTADQRLPYFTLPPWVRDPFRRKPSTDGRDTARTLKGGVYTITNVISSRSAGGVYLARDKTRGRTVILKEARPHTAWAAAGCDAVTLLKKEFRLLDSLLDGIFADTRDRKYAVNAGHFMGLAGIGHFTLDLYQALGDPKDTDGNYLAVCLPRGAAENRPRLGAGGNFISISAPRKAPVLSGCESRPATVAPAGSSRSGWWR